MSTKLATSMVSTFDLNDRSTYPNGRSETKSQTAGE